MKGVSLNYAKTDTGCVSNLKPSIFILYYDDKFHEGDLSGDLSGKLAASPPYRFSDEPSTLSLRMHSSFLRGTQGFCHH